MKKLLLALFVSSPALAADSFSFNLYDDLAKSPGNVFFSPYSVASALSMTKEGARGKTLEEIEKVLGKEPLPSGSELADGFTELTTANRLWGRLGEKFEASFLEITKKKYGAELQALDFAAKAEESRRTINAWVEKKTHDRIKDLLPQGTLNAATELVLTNAIYFKGHWDHSFSTSLTRPRAFHSASGPASQHAFLNGTQRVAYWENDQVQVIRLPYEGNQVGMTIFLPKTGKKPRFDAKLLAEFRAKAESHRVEISIPKFRLEFSAGLAGPLARMGMPLAFTEKADFGGIRKLDPQRPLFLSAVLHKAFVDVDEEGTEAAAATALVMVGAAAVIEQEQPKIFIADRPFYFVIEHVPTGAPLFMGRLEKL